jgi:CPA1 family monovalent cation:H+ antiporter
MNGLIFMLIGLQLPSIVRQLGNTSLVSAIWYGVAVSLVLIVARFLCTFGASLFTRFIGRFITVADRNPGFKAPIILGWSGMRGVVSLAMALSIPLVIGTQAFTHRNLILFITFIVILVTLVFQGLTLPWLIRKINLEDKYSPVPELKQEKIIQKKIAQASLQLLEEKYDTEKDQNRHLNNLVEKLKIDLSFFQEDLKELSNANGGTLINYQNIYLEILERQRELLYEMNRRSEFDEDLIRKYLSLIDLEEFKIREKKLDEN